MQPGLYRHLLTRENFRFARQAGTAHIAAQLVDYFNGGAHNPDNRQPAGTGHGRGRAGIPIRGYNFSRTGVCGRTTGLYARGRTMSVGPEGPLDEPMLDGTVWSMIYDADAPAGFLRPCQVRTPDETQKA